MASSNEFDAMYHELAAGSFRPVIDRVFSLEEGPAAFQHFESGDGFGKVVLRIV